MGRVISQWILKEMGCEGVGLDLALGRHNRRVIVNAVVSLRAPWCAGNFLTGWETLRFWRTLLLAVYFDGIRSSVCRKFHISSLLKIHELRKSLPGFPPPLPVSVNYHVLLCGLDGSRFASPQGEREFLFSGTVQSGCGAHPVSYSHWGYQGCHPGVKRLGRAVDRSPPSSAEIKNEWSCTSVPLYVIMAMMATTYVWFTELHCR
jgi:hypothetical protein